MDSAEDLAQETFLRVYRSRTAYEPTAGFQTWLYRIATNVALNYIRDHKHDAASMREHDEERADRSLLCVDVRPSISSVLETSGANNGIVP